METIKRFIFHIFFIAFAFFVLDVYLIGSGMTVEGGLWGYFILALFFGIANSILKPIIKEITLPINILTLGLLTLVINAGLPLLVQWLLTLTDLGVGLELADWTLYPIVGLCMTGFALLIP